MVVPPSVSVAGDGTANTWETQDEIRLGTKFESILLGKELALRGGWIGVAVKITSVQNFIIIKSISDEKPFRKGINFESVWKSIVDVKQVKL